MSIFKRVDEIKDDQYQRRSFYEIDTDGDGYVFIINAGHPFFEKISNHE